MTYQAQEGQYIIEAIMAGQPYTLYGVCADGEVLCQQCMRGNAGLITRAMYDGGDDQWDVVGVDTHLEGAPMTCAHCGDDITSDYGDPQGEGEQA